MSESSNGNGRITAFGPIDPPDPPPQTESPPVRDQPEPKYDPASFPAKRIAGQWNRPAVASFVFGALICLPGASFLAVIFGMLGYRRARDPYVGGTGFATLGLIFGILGSVVWLALGAYAARILLVEKPAMVLVGQFQRDLGGGHVRAASALCDPRITPARIVAASNALRTWGALGQMTMPVPFREVAFKGKTCWQGSTITTFANRKMRCTFIVRKRANGSFCMMSFVYATLKKKPTTTQPNPAVSHNAPEMWPTKVVGQPAPTLGGRTSSPDSRRPTNVVGNSAPVIRPALGPPARKMPAAPNAAPAPAASR